MYAFAVWPGTYSVGVGRGPRLLPGRGVEALVSPNVDASLAFFARSGIDETPRSVPMYQWNKTGTQSVRACLSPSMKPFTVLPW